MPVLVLRNDRSSVAIRAILSRSVKHRPGGEGHSRILENHRQDQEGATQAEAGESKYSKWPKPLDRRSWFLIFPNSYTLHNIRRELVTSVQRVSDVMNVFSCVAGMHTHYFGIRCGLELLGPGRTYEDLRCW